MNMKKLALIFIFLLFCCIGICQNKKNKPKIREVLPYLTLSKLVVEDVNFEAIMKQIESGNTSASDFFKYKLVTTLPVNPLKEVEERYVIDDSRYAQYDKYGQLLRFIRLFSEGIKLREPLPDEDRAWLYYTFEIDSDSLPLVANNEITRNIYIRDSVYVVGRAPNFYDLPIFFENKLVADDGSPVKLGKRYKFTTLNTGDKVKFTVAIELSCVKFDNISKGTIGFRFGVVSVPTVTTISKEDIGNRVYIGSVPHEVLAFDRGVIHLRYITSFVERERKYHPQKNKVTYIAHLGDKKFPIKGMEDDFIYSVYRRFTEKIGLSYDKFVKYINNTKKVNFIPADLNASVKILNFGYDIDKITVAGTNRGYDSCFNYKVAISKKEDNTIAVIDLARDYEKIFDVRLNHEFADCVRKFISDEIAFQGIHFTEPENIRLKYKISPEGRMYDIEVIMPKKATATTNRVLQILSSAGVIPYANLDIVPRGIHFTTGLSLRLND